MEEQNGRYMHSGTGASAVVTCMREGFIEEQAIGGVGEMLFCFILFNFLFSLGRDLQE